MSDLIRGLLNRLIASDPERDCCESCNESDCTFAMAKACKRRLAWQVQEPLGGEVKHAEPSDDGPPSPKAA